MNKKNLMYLIVALLLNFACSPSIKNYEPDNNSQGKPDVQLRDENFMRIEKLLDRFVNEQKIPGLQLAISFSDSTSWAITRGTLKRFSKLLGEEYCEYKKRVPRFIPLRFKR